MVMWIVLGSLIGVVVIFLIVTSTLDRKKSKKIKIEKDTLAKEIFAAGTKVSKEVKKVITKNEKSIKAFVPSVGKLKMSDINKDAREALKKIERSKDFKLLKHNTDQFNLFSNHLKALLFEKSNNWSKRNEEDVKFFKEYTAPKEEVVKTKKEAKKTKADKKTKAPKNEIKNPVSKKASAAKGKK